MTTSTHRPATASASPAGRICLALLFSIQWATAATFWVAPDGADSQPGTESKPFWSIKRAQQAASPGDTVFIRGGTYHLTDADISKRESLIASIVHLDKDGEKGRPISYLAKPGERPVFDCSQVKPDGLRVSAFRVRASWIHIKGLEVTGVQVTAKGHTQSICFDNLGSHNIYEQLSMHDGQAIGLYIARGSDNLVLNCDAWRNHDFTSEGGRGGNTDGFGCHSPGRSPNNVFKGCRAWFNSDDGFDCINAGDVVTFINCWSFYNGYSPDFKRLGDGNGFKAGGYGVQPDARFPDPVPRHRVGRCLAVRNPSSGFYANHHPGGIDWIHNSAFRNGVNFNFLGRSADASSDIPGEGHKILNNLSYGSKRDFSNLSPANNHREGNSFDSKAKLTDSDFLSLDEASLTAPRKADGTLPEVRFLRLASGNPLIDAGVSTNAPHKGAAPDVGAFEYQPRDSFASGRTP